MNAHRLLNADDRRRIEEAVDRAESKTSAEIVCAVATESGRYDRAESIIGLALALLALGVAHIIYGWSTTAGGDWTGSGVSFGWQAFAVVAGFVSGNFLANRVRQVRRLVVGEGEMDAEVRGAAAYAFALGAVANTANRTGLLIYISIFERRVRVLPDEQVREVLGDEEIGRLRDLAVTALRRGDFAGAFVDPLQEAAPLLARALPADRKLNPDELPNHVLTFHPRPGREEGQRIGE